MGTGQLKGRHFAGGADLDPRLLVVMLATNYFILGGEGYI